jgi:hypothetical protein
MLAYLGSKVLYSGALAIVQSLIFVLVLTFLNAQANHFMQAWLMMGIMTMQGVLLGLLISAVARTAERAMYLLPLLLIPQLLLGGLLMPVAKRHPFTVVKAGETAQCTDRTAPTSGYCLEDAPSWTLQEEMPRPLALGISPLMVSRWGLEGLSDLYSHDYLGGDPVAARYSFQNLGAVYVTLHPNDEQQARAEMTSVVNGAASVREKQKDPSTVFYEYCLILAAIGGFMFLLIALALRSFIH